MNLQSTTNRKIISALMIPVGYILGTVLGQAIYSLLGYEVGTTNAPVWVKIVSSAPMFIFLFFAIRAVSKVWRKATNK